MMLQNRTLADITDELHVALRREAADILTIGALLAEAKERVPHGMWLPWLTKKFSISDRSAQKYMKAADFAAKYELGADLNLTPSALYLLSEDNYWKESCGRREATDAVLKAAKGQRLEYDQVKEIVDRTVAELAVNSGTQSEMSAASGVPEHQRSRSGVNRPDALLSNFTTVVLELDRLTKSRQADRFAKTAVPADMLARLGQLLMDIADRNKSVAKPTPHPAPGTGILPDRQLVGGMHEATEAVGDGSPASIRSEGPEHVRG